MANLNYKCSGNACGMALLNPKADAEFAELSADELKDLGFAKRAIQKHQN